jgi:hypothetical protein
MIGKFLTPYIEFAGDGLTRGEDVPSDPHGESIDDRDSARREIEGEHMRENSNYKRKVNQSTSYLLAKLKP